MPDKESKPVNIPVLRDVVIPVTANANANKANVVAVEPSLLNATLQAEIDTIINQARTDFEATIAQLQKEMQQRVKRELNELHVQLTTDD